MADQTIVHMGENSPEHVALQLLRLVAGIEGKPLNNQSGINRKWLLDTYAECLLAIRDPNYRVSR